MHVYVVVCLWFVVVVVVVVKFVDSLLYVVDCDVVGVGVVVDVDSMGGSGSRRGS